MAIIAFIPVRGGSKSIPLKNIKNLCHRPLIYWVLKELQDVQNVDKIVVSTDCTKIHDTVCEFGFAKVELFKRSELTATDTATTESAMLEYIEHSNLKLQDSDIFMLVQATSPLTQKIHFEQAICEYLNSEYDSLLSCVETKRFFWNKNGEPINYNYIERPRRQDFDGMLMENGAFYISKIKQIKETKNRISGNIGIYIMPEYTSIEIDEEIDWIIMENLMRRYHSSFARETSPIKIFISDVDGVLTDSGMYYSENGDELKKFNTKDGMAFQILKERGIKTGIITSEKTKIVERRARKIKSDYLFQAKKFGGKLEAVKEICTKEGFDLKEVAYIGDDINCTQLLKEVGLPACPFDAVDEIKKIPGIKILDKKGGEGVVRELVEFILNNYS